MKLCNLFPTSAVSYIVVLLPQKFKEDIQGSVLHYVLDCGHIPHVEKPDEVSAVLLDFIKK